VTAQGRAAGQAAPARPDTTGGPVNAARTAETPARLPAPAMESWSFLTNHARVLLRIAQDPAARLRDIAASLGITERSAYSIVTDLTDAGYVLKHKDGRRNRYQVQVHLPLPDPVGQEPAIGDVLAALIGEAAAAS